MTPTVYTGETRAKKLRERLRARGVGLVVQRGRVTKAAIEEWPCWCYDNLAFGDWTAGRAFDDDAFMRDVRAMLELPEEHRPDFAVLPDQVAAGSVSLAMSLAWLARLGRLPIRWALAVQDGMTPDVVPWGAPFEVIFVGGSTRWKLETAGAWVEAAHAHAHRVHVGRVGSARRVRWARSIGADSFDSALPLWGERNLRPFEAARDGAVQTAMPWAAPLIGAAPRAPRTAPSTRCSTAPARGRPTS